MTTWKAWAWVMIAGAVLSAPGAGATIIIVDTGGDTQYDACEDSDFSGGTGGQDVGCAIRCLDGNRLTVSVTAVDPDADVKGSNECGGGVSDCDENDNHCDAGDGYAEDDSTNGWCEGHSDELWDSGLTVECTTVTPGGSGSSARIEVLGPGLVQGLVCHAGSCIPVVPTCLVDARGLHCSIGAR